MLVFLDTEFSRLPAPLAEGYRPRPRLISLALVAEGGGQEFYAELIDGWSISQCSDFVRREVLPSLGKVPGASCTRADLVPRLEAWFQSLPEPATLVYDFYFDWELLVSAFPSSLPPNISDKLLLAKEVVNDPIYQQALNRTFTRDWPPHHALADARAIRNGYLAWRDSHATQCAVLITLAGTHLRAEFNDGRTETFPDVLQLVDRLHTLGIEPGQVNALDWHIDPDRAPLGGKKIAIFSALRSKRQRDK